LVDVELDTLARKAGFLNNLLIFGCYYMVEWGGETKNVFIALLEKRISPAVVRRTDSFLGQNPFLLRHNLRFSR
jgi:hypothetical protein